MRSWKHAMHNKFSTQLVFTDNTRWCRISAAASSWDTDTYSHCMSLGAPKVAITSSSCRKGIEWMLSYEIF